MSHTPAPWRLAQRAHTKGPPSKDPEDAHLDYFHISAGDVGRDGWEISGYMRPDDARVITAAPELLEALNRMYLASTNFSCVPSEDDIEAAKRAIAKASPGTECSICRRVHGRETVHEAE